MNIAIDVLAVLGPDSKNRGIGNYTTSQLRNLFAQDKENKYFLLNFYENTSLKDLLHYGDNVSEHYYYLGHEGFIGKNEDFKEVFGGLIKNFLIKNEIDIFYFTSPFDPLISYDMDWFSNVKTVATLYDIIPYIFKDRYLPDKTHYTNYMQQIKKILKMDKLLAISESAKNDILNNFDYKSENIDVIYAGTDEWFKILQVNPIESENIRNTYNIKDEFVMCTGGDDERKNIGDLIIAYSKMPKELIERFQLVIACKLSQESERRYYDLAKKHDVRNRVILTNFVPTEHLVLLYNLAYVVSFPSKYEGFGLPVVEAMACGTPVLTSNNSSLGEIAEGAAILVDPFNIQDITRGLIEILNYDDIGLLIDKGYERVKLFTWEKVAKKTFESFNKIFNSNKKTDIQKIAYFSPIPPIKSGISDYSIDILNGLSNYMSIDVYIDKGYKPILLNNEKVKIYDHSSFESKCKEYDEIIYQMGNSEYHQYMLKYIKKYPGTVVLHDYNLHGLLYHLFTQDKDIEAYRNSLYEDFDKEIDEYILNLSQGKTYPHIYEMMTNGIVTNYANKVIVHSDYSKKLLLEKDIKHKVKKILHYAKIEPLEDIGDTKRKFNVDQNKFIISAFGHIHETKRIMPILKAYNQLINIYDDLILYLVGKPSESIKVEIEEYIKKNDLGEKVIITGYTELEEFDVYIDISDITLNLRYPYNGETSGSLMRILAKGKCVLVNNLGSFAEVPDNCCIKLTSPENLNEEAEIQMIKENLEKLIQNRAQINIFGENAKQYAIENLELNKIIEQYILFLGQPKIDTITEKKLSEISEYIINNIGVDSREFYEISKTLSSCK